MTRLGALQSLNIADSDRGVAWQTRLSNAHAYYDSSGWRLALNIADSWCTVAWQCLVCPMLTSTINSYWRTTCVVQCRYAHRGRLRVLSWYMLLRIVFANDAEVSIDVACPLTQPWTIKNHLSVLCSLTTLTCIYLIVVRLQHNHWLMEWDAHTLYNQIWYLVSTNIQSEAFYKATFILTT